MNITNAQFTAEGSITALVDGVQMSIPADAGNRHYAAMLEQGIEIAEYVEPSVTQEEQEAKRQAAYTTEADPLFFKWQAGEGTEAEWLAKREEIRERYPYPKEAGE